MNYDHTQKAPLGAIVLLSAVLCAAVVIGVTPQPAGIIVGVGVASLLALLSFCFRELRVRDESTHLGVRFGPLPFFRTRVPYAKITAVKPARSTFIDGWGIHWVPGRGMIYNLWGFDCVEIHMGKKCVRVGTDDPDGLVAFLKNKRSSSSCPGTDDRVTT